MECVSELTQSIEQNIPPSAIQRPKLERRNALSCTTVQGICTIAVNFWVFVVWKEGRVSQYDSGQMSKDKLNEVQRSPKAHTADALEDADRQPS